MKKWGRKEGERGTTWNSPAHVGNQQNRGKSDPLGCVCSVVEVWGWKMGMGWLSWHRLD